MLGITLFSFIFSIGISLFFTRQILAQVGGEPAVIARVTEQIAKGDLNVEFEGTTGIIGSVGAMTTTLKESEQRYNILVASLNDGLNVIDENCMITFTNEKLCEMLG